MLRNRIRFIILLLALLIPTAAVLAADTITIGNLRVDLVSHVENADDTDTFTYAVTAISATQELSHWSLGIDTCLDFLVSPQEGSYTTITDITECGDNTYACETANYTVETGSDPTLEIYGIKFEEGSPQLDNPNTHVFEITVSDVAYVDLVNVGAKYGENGPTGKIDGPVCGSGTAVSLASSSVNSGSTGMLVPLVLTAMLMLTVVTLFVSRR